ncbi:MAG: extensin family protein, partial [bacterium]
LGILFFPWPAQAFPLRMGEDSFYGEGIPEGDGFATWMGYAVKYNPPYVPYTVSGISIYVQEMTWSGNPPDLWVAVLDQFGIMRQYAKLSWEEFGDKRGWVLIPLAEKTYCGEFTVILNSGIGLPSDINGNKGKSFCLGVDTTEPGTYSYLYTSDRVPPIPPIPGPGEVSQLDEQSKFNLSKIVDVTNVIRDFPKGNWMIRAHAPNLQMETTHIEITQEFLEEWLKAREPKPPASVQDWHLPPIDGYGPRGMVACPTSLAGVTFFYYESSREMKFIFPHNGPWINTDLEKALGAMCQEMAAKEGLVGIEHIGIFNNRNIQGTNIKSSHAFGLGIDISGFQFADGRTVMVEDHDDPAVRKTLCHIRDTYLKKYFPTVLDWTYQNHNNHFHVNLPYNP